MQLENLYSKGEAEAIAHWVLEHYTGLGRMAIKMHRDKLLSLHEKYSINNALKELVKHRPVQYVLGEAWFKGMKLEVNESVLIPRPETEELVDWALEELHGKSSNIPVLDVGTGTGCIAIAIKKAFPPAEITAIDNSGPALKVASNNAVKNKVEINFQLLDFLSRSAQDQLATYQLIVSNPPYIPVKEKKHLDKQVTEWEPGTALFVPDEDPLVFYRKLAEFGQTHLEPNGRLLMECHQDYANATRELFESAGYQTLLRKDIFENERMVKATLVPHP